MRFEDLTVRLSRGAVILRGVTGSFGHSRMHAVMGPSGCGKSTFLASLAGTLPKGRLTGRVQYSRHHGHRSFVEEYARVR